MQTNRCHAAGRLLVALWIALPQLDGELWSAAIHVFSQPEPALNGDRPQYFFGHDRPLNREQLRSRLQSETSEVRV